MSVVSDASPICYLALIDCLDLLPALFAKVIVPPAVLRELGDAGAPERVRALTAALPEWIEVHALRDPPDEGLVDLDPGEREAIALAEELGASLLLLDDKIARKVAAERGVVVTGLLGVLGKAAEQGLVDLPAAITRLRRTNFRASPQLLKSLLDRSQQRT